MVEKIIFADQPTKIINYIASPEGIAAIEITSNPGGKEWYWVFSDHYGSNTALMRESDGQYFEKSFDACSVKPDFCECSDAKSLVEPIPAEERGREGNRRNADTWENNTTSLPDFIIDRGFTGHEHLELFSIINMNGRIYDPVLGIFFTPDPLLQFPDFPIGLNPYSYCLNSPLSFVDPTGYRIDGVFFNVVRVLAMTVVTGYFGLS